MLPIPKLGWMAGIIDLKGIFLRKNNKMRATPQIVLAVESKQFAIIRELGSLTGTSPELKKQVAKREFMRRGCADHCPEAHVHIGDEGMLPAIARWTITGAGMAVVLYNLMPFLIMDKPYKEYMDEAIENAPLTGQGSAAVLTSLRRLAMIGWELPEPFELDKVTE